MRARGKAGKRPQPEQIYLDRASRWQKMADDAEVLKLCSNIVHDSDV
jgi:hypothetical protein